MGFRINTNVTALNANKDSALVGREIDSSLEKLSSGQRINKASDDSSGLMIADNLRNQANSLGQSVRNVNDAIGIVQIADKAMDEQIKILDTIKVKATQSAQDGQTYDTRKALQADTVRLLEELDNIAFTTSFNGQNLLAGSFNNKEFQIGAFSNESIKASIPATNANKIGETRFETGSMIKQAGTVQLTFSAVNTAGSDLVLESVIISTSVNTGIGVLAQTINKNSDALGGIKASWNLVTTGLSAVASGDITGLTINGILVGDVYDIQANDKDGKLVNAINDIKTNTGVEAYIDNRGNLNLRSLDGRGIQISGTNLDTIGGLSANALQEYGRLTLTRIGAKDIQVYGTGAGGLAAGFSAGATVAEAVMNIAGLRGTIDKDVASAIGGYANSNVELFGEELGSGITTMAGAMAIMSVADHAQKSLDKIRADLGSVQNQLVSTVNNISVTQVSAKSGESYVRDVDFAEEVANFQKNNLLSQSGSFAMSQSNQVSQNVMKLLQ